jgi:hypothetical protein
MKNAPAKNVPPRGKKYWSEEFSGEECSGEELSDEKSSGEESSTNPFKYEKVKKSIRIKQVVAPVSLLYPRASETNLKD